jgi:hypothetical protein
MYKTEVRWQMVCLVMTPKIIVSLLPIHIQNKHEIRPYRYRCPVFCPKSVRQAVDDRGCTLGSQDQYDIQTSCLTVLRHFVQHRWTKRQQQAELLPEIACAVCRLQVLNMNDELRNIDSRTNLTIDVPIDLHTSQTLNAFSVRIRSILTERLM